MKILLLTGFVLKESNANINIVCSLAKALSKMGCDVYIDGIIFDEYLSKSTANTIFSSETAGDYYINKFNRFFLDNNYTDLSLHTKIKIFIKEPILSSRVFLNQLQKNVGKMSKSQMRQYSKELKLFMKANPFDKMIVFWFPQKTIRKTVIDKFKGGIIYYQLDPYALHYSGNSKPQLRINEEVELFKKVKKIVTTKILYEKYKHKKEYEQLLDKIHYGDFPLIINMPNHCEQSIFNFEKGFVNFLFCGRLADSYRSPEFVFKVLEKKYLTDKQIRIYFLGTSQSVILIEKQKEYPNRFFSHTAVDRDIAHSIMQQADVLINIGNNIENMLPSKIFDYFSTGKPIINFQKIENCPAKEYFDKYPLQFTINEFEEFTKEKEMQLEDFILNSKNKKVNFEEIEKIYYEATPKYVAKQILEIIGKED